MLSVSVQFMTFSVISDLFGMMISRFSPSVMLVARM